MPLYIAKSGDLDRCYRCLTDWQTTLKDRATQLLIKYKSGALVTQYGKHILSPFLGFMNFYWFIIKSGEVTNTTIVRMQWFLQFLNTLTHLHTCTLYGCNDFFSSFLKLLISNHWAGAEKLWLEEKFCTWQNNGRLFEILCNLKDFTKRALAGYFPFDLVQWLLLTINNDISSD